MSSVEGAEIRQPASKAPGRRGIGFDVVGEALFLLLVLVAFVYLLVVSRGWPLSAALLPTLAAGTGLPLLLVHIYRRFRTVSGPTRQILDIGFTEEGLTSQQVRARTVQMLGSMVALFLGIWLVGFHIALPLYVFLYMVKWGESSIWAAGLTAAIFLGILVGLYDNVIHTSWNEPVLQSLLGLRR